jgi:hypothetical protein
MLTAHLPVQISYRYAANYDALDGGDAAGALGFDDLREQLLQKVRV